LLADPTPKVRANSLRALTSYANWRYQPAQEALIQQATDKNAAIEVRENAADAIAQAIRLQAAGVRQDPPMFKALVSLLSERGKNASLHDIAFLALAPVYSFTVGGADEGQSPPAGGWQKWLDSISTEQAGDMTYYEVCARSEPETAVKLFCDGGAWLRKNPSLAFQSTLKSAQAGYAPAQEVVGMMYATGKGVQQDYTEAGKWFLSAAEKGEYRAAVHYAGDLRDGESPLRRNTELAARWAKYVSDHPEFSPRQRRQNAAPSPAGAPGRGAAAADPPIVR
jgi:TPR repeat protein